MSEIINQIKDKLKDKMLNFFQKSATRVYIDLKPEDIPNAARYLFSDMGTRFVIASGVDTPKGIEILYHFSLDAEGIIFSLRTLLDKNSPEIESLAPIFKAAEWIEREIHELLGVNFKNHPNLTRLLLPEDWPEGNCPLRQEERT